MKTLSLISFVLLFSSCQKEALELVPLKPIKVLTDRLQLKQIAVPCALLSDCKEMLVVKMAELQKKADQICEPVIGEISCCSNGVTIGYSLFATPKTGACFAENLKEVGEPKLEDSRLSFNVSVKKSNCIAGGINLTPEVLDEDLKGLKFGYVFRWALDDQKLTEQKLVDCSWSIRYTLYVTRISDLKTISFKGFLIKPIEQ